MSINTAEQHWRHQLTVSFTANVEFLLRWVGCRGGDETAGNEYCRL